jgi:hypothetical protein
LTGSFDCLQNDYVLCLPQHKGQEDKTRRELEEAYSMAGSEEQMPAMTTEEIVGMIKQGKILL